MGVAEPVAGVSELGEQSAEQGVVHVVRGDDRAAIVEHGAIHGELLGEQLLGIFTDELGLGLPDTR